LGREVAGQLALAQTSRHALTRCVQHVAHVDPVGTDVQAAALQPGHVQQIADVATEALGLLADRQQKVGADGRLKLVAQVDQGGRGPQHRRQRRSQIMAD